jgi:hypothetical protein
MEGNSQKINRHRFTDYTYGNSKYYRQKKPPNALPQREAKNQAEHYEEELLGGITPGGS